MPSSLATPVSICNEALAAIGSKPIQTLNDNNERAKWCLTFYDRMREELLRRCFWTFTKKEITLNLIGQNLGTSGLSLNAAPNPALTIANDPNPADFNTPFPWGYLYQYPAGCLYIVKIYSNILSAGVMLDLLDPEDNWFQDQRIFLGESEYELIRGNTTNQYAIATNLQNAMAKFIFNTTDTSQFDPVFSSALALKIAQKIAKPLTASKEVKDDVDAELDAVMTDAFRLNLAENPERQQRVSSFQRVRGSW